MFHHAALDPDPVINVSVSLEPTVPSITLTWEPPTNAINAEMVTKYKYQLRISSVGVEQCTKLTVDGSTTRVVLTRELGLTSLVHYHLQVRPMAGDDAGDWRSVTAYFGMFITMCSVVGTGTGLRSCILHNGTTFNYL